MPWANQETLLRKHYVSYQRFPVCPPRQTLLGKKIPSMQLAAMFSKKFKNILVAQAVFASCPTCLQHEKLL